MAEFKNTKEFSKLTQAKFYALCEWLKPRAADFAKDSTNYVDVAAVASKELGFKVGAPQISNATEIIGCRWESKAKRLLGAMGKLALLEQTLAETTAALRDAHGRLRGNHNALCAKIGEPQLKDSGPLPDTKNIACVNLLPK